MTHKKYMEDQDAEEPDDFIISLTAQVRLYTFLSDFILLGTLYFCSLVLAVTPIFSFL